MHNAPTSRVVVLASCFAALCAGCAGTQFARETSAQRIAPNGSGPSPAALPLQLMAPSEWAAAPKQQLKPVCDARSQKTDAEPLDKAKRVVEMWADFNKKKPKPGKPTGVTIGQLAGIAPSTTRRIDSLNLSCAPGAPFTLEVNGVAHPFDLAWAVSQTGTRAAFLAISMKDKMVVFAEVTVPSTPKGDPLETAVVTNMGNYVPANMDEPVVRNLHGRQGDVLFETLTFGKGTTEGFYWLVPRSADLGVDRFVEVGRFKVGS
jgi:hypothetical protein